MRLSETARVTTAHEAAFRVQYPNSQPRLIKVIALDEAAGHVVRELAAKPWNRAVFFNSLSFPSVGDVGSGRTGGEAGSATRMKAWLSDVAGHASELVAEIDSADIVVVIASPGTDAQAATIIGEACRLRHKTMIGLILQTKGVSDEALSRTLLGMRPLATMLVVASGSEYVEEMLSAMRA
jgi:hypothetical protein